MCPIVPSNDALEGGENPRHFLDPGRWVLNSMGKRHQSIEMVIREIKMCSETNCDSVGQQDMIIKYEYMDGYGQLAQGPSYNASGGSQKNSSEAGGPVVNRKFEVGVSMF